MTPSKSLSRTLLLGAFVFAVCSPQAVLAHGSGKKLKADPFVFVGKANVCDTSYPEGSNIVTSAWLGGLGLPDDGSLNSQGPFNNLPAPTPRDRHTGLILSKNGPTWECASAGVRIKGWRPGNTITALGFDYRNGGHCGAGAPRFNIFTMDGQLYFAGCSHGTLSAAPQDPTEWTRVVLDDTLQLDPPDVFKFGGIGIGTPVKNVTLIYDEGTDTVGSVPGTNTEGIGLAILDNIRINDKYITSGRGIEPESDGEGHHH